MLSQECRCKVCEANVSHDLPSFQVKFVQFLKNDQKQVIWFSWWCIIEINLFLNRPWKRISKNWKNYQLSNARSKTSSVNRDICEKLQKNFVNKLKNCSKISRYFSRLLLRCARKWLVSNTSCWKFSMAICKTCFIIVIWKWSLVNFATVKILPKILLRYQLTIIIAKN